MATFVTYTLDLFDGTNVTGGNKRFKELVCSLAEKGDTIHLFIPNNANFPTHDNIIRYSLKKPESSILPVGLLAFIMNYRKLSSIKKFNCEKVILVSVPYGIQGALLGLKNLALILWEDFIGVRRIKYQQKKLKILNGFKIKVLTIIEAYALKIANQIISQCNYDKKQLIQRHKKLEQEIATKTYVIPNNVNPSWIKQHETLISEKANRRKSEEFTIYFIGNLNDPKKGAHILLEAVSKLIEKEYHIRLIVIGGGKLLSNYAQKYSKYKQIEFWGYQKNPMQYLVNADLLVVPSLVDSFPNTIMEGLFLEIPVIGSRRGGIPEMLQDEELLFEPEADQLFHKIASLLDNNTYKKYRDLCLKRKEALHFDWGEAMRELLH
jgi:glycosyltransferase involved in cell wall biosynthesis